eukprot:CAMPEP_0198512206 /NCGR_PEP_ID=MMETSP1462-20131121/15298_1 /TAXON_ID=1333877 /ORGANISM="Brandtodinium nutriculum, Strain RCC3387" /LENGTH=37 /DNA_ID= /DNA_START= /DNA_END= /DNA_ORIENTATION=
MKPLHVLDMRIALDGCVAAKRRGMRLAGIPREPRVGT